MTRRSTARRYIAPGISAPSSSHRGSRCHGVRGETSQGLPERIIRTRSVAAPAWAKALPCPDPGRRASATKGTTR
jgi:hypothetical protein